MTSSDPTTRHRSVNAVLLALACLAGCSVAPPLPLADDPDLSLECLPAGERFDWRLGVAATDQAYLGEGELAGWGQLAALGSVTTTAVASAVDLAAVDSTTPTPVGSPSVAVVGSGEVAAVVSEHPLAVRDYTWETPPSLAGQLSSRLSDACSWALTTSATLTIQPPASADDPSGELLSMAAAEGVDLLLHVELLDQRVAWVERDGGWWVANFLLFYGPGLFPVVMIADEVFEVGVRVRVTLVDVEGRRALLAREFAAVEQRSLNDSERGWSLSGFFFLYPYTLDEDAYASVQEALLPHALKDLELQVVRWLREERGTLEATAPAPR